MPLEKDQIGYLKYSGPLVEAGVMDARSLACALNGFDNALRYFLIQKILI